MGTLASHAEIGVWVQAILCILTGKCFAMPSKMRSKNGSFSTRERRYHALNLEMALTAIAVCIDLNYIPCLQTAVKY